MSEKQRVLAGYGDRICLNYIDFLSASCKKRWRFVDAIYGVLPIFGMVTRTPSNRQRPVADQLKELALQIISTQVSDEINIARLITLADQQHISQLDIILPYPLSGQQLDLIKHEYRKPVALSQQGERLNIQFPGFPH
ncbi:hypothetical protein ED28_01365 [[Pantoea] beijingensis]|uniref:Uncharacterized protein n=1 Tax=[Pantoea] beijingensis TaxID=1324864 RepID=A0A443II10_9GAMM|nr:MULTISPECIES: hypothetical protein [Erwiniaceae]RWR03663.1 hypothetical protein ED28_01365 [[Pantoea] beijingensis]